MPFTSTICLTNSQEQPVTLHLEPWGEQIEMLPGKTFVITAEAESPGTFEIEHGAKEVMVWAWEGSIVRVTCEGQVLGMDTGLERPRVPQAPAGQTTSSFLRMMLGRGKKRRS